MEAKDTTIGAERLIAIQKEQEAAGSYDNPRLPLALAVALEQAEISFPKGEEQGYKAGYDKALAQLAEMTEECKQMGRREVMEQLAHTKVYFIQTEETRYIWWLTDEAKLKEWGIDEDRG